MNQNSNFNYPFVRELRIKAPKGGLLARDKPIDSHGRNLPKCDDHSFCSVKYEFHECKQDEGANQEERARTASIRKYSRGRQTYQPFNLSQLSEEALDDWILQSLNRPLSQALDNKKKFEMPLQYQEELKSRYSHQRNQKMSMENKEYYFSDAIPHKSQKFILQNGKSILNPMNLLFDHSLLEPKTIIGQPINQREEQKLKRQKIIDFRRGGMLKNDEEAYALRVKLEMLTNSSVTNQKKAAPQQLIQSDQQEQTPEKECLFLQNYDNFTRNRTQKSEVLGSFGQNELLEVNQLIAQQHAQWNEAEKQLNKMNDQSELEASGTYEQQNHFYQQQHQKFKRQMNMIVGNFKQFISDSYSETIDSNVKLAGSFNEQLGLNQPQMIQQAPNLPPSYHQESRINHISLLDTSMLTPKLQNFVHQGQSLKYKSEKQSFHNQRVHERVRRQIKDQFEKKDLEQSSIVDKEQSANNATPTVQPRRVPLWQRMPEKFKTVNNSWKKRRSLTQSRASQRPSTSGTAMNNSTNMTKQLLQWYQSETETQINQIPDGGASQQGNLARPDTKRRASTAFPQNKTIELLNINSMISKMNQDRSVEYHPDMNKDQALNHSQMKKQVNQRSKADIARQIDEVIERPNSFQSRLLTSSNVKNSSFSRKQNLTPNSLPNLSLKTKKLLNTVSEDRIKYKPELVGFQSQLTPIQVQFKKKELTQSEFWFNKGVLSLKTNPETSLYCFKQSLIHNPTQFESIQNIGIIYEQIGKYSTSQKWFQLALQFRETNELKFGLAICLYKMGQFQSALSILNGIIENEEVPLYIYLRGICAKRLFDLETAAQNYKIVKQKSRAINYELCVDFMMAVIFSQTRQLEIKFNPFVFCQFHKLVTQVIESEYYVESLVAYWSQQRQEWQSVEDLLKKLSRLSFFKRIAASILRSFLSKMSLHVVESDQVIFPKENEVHIIVAGNINVYDHRGQFSRPEIVANYKEGDIIGCPEMDNGLCNISDIWFLTQTQMEYISLNKNYFDELWQAQVQQEGMEMFTRMEKLPIFRGVSQLTLHKLVYELLEKLSVRKNTVLFNDCSYQESYEYIHLRKPTKGSANQRSNLVAQRQGSYQMKLKKLILKHRIQINKLKYNRVHIDGFYVILIGECELENPNGFSNFYLNYGDYFGESLMFSTKSYNSYGRIRVSSTEATVFKLSRFNFNKIPTLDLKIMESNCVARKEINDLDQIYNNRMRVQEMRRNRVREKGL